MSLTPEEEVVHVGIDVSKVRLDVCVKPEGRSFAVTNDQAGIDELLERLGRLESRRYVQRTPNPEDRRSALVGITKTGIEESLRHLQPYIEDMRALEEGFSEEERAVVVQFLRAATRATQRAAGGIDE